MANKILNTRIMLRYASHEDWISNDPILQRGEVAVATVATKQSTAGKNGPVNYVPSVLLKVGDGEHKYSELDFTFAKAADVLEACKDEATLKAFVNTVIGEAGIATDEAMQALATRVTTAEGDIDALEALVGVKKVETQISEAIAALNLANTYEAKGTAASAIAALDLANTYEAKGTAASAIAALNLANTYEAKGAAAAALTEAKSYTDGKDSAMDTRVKAIEAKFGDGEGNVESQIEAAVAAEAAIARAAEQANATAIATEKSRAEAAEQANANAIAGVVADYTTHAQAKAYADAKDTAIKAAQDKADANATEIANVKATAEAAYVLPEGGIEDDLSDGVKASLAKADSALQAADIANLATKGEVEAVAGELDTLSDKVDAEIEARIAADNTHTADIAANTAAIAKLNGDDKTEGSVDYKVAQEVAKILNDNDADDIDTLEEIAAWIKNDTAGVGALNKKVTDNEAAIAKLNGDASTEGSVDKKIADAITAENLSQYALDTDVEALTTRVKANEDALAIVNGDAETAGSIAKAQADAEKTAKDYADGLAGNYATAAQGAKADTAIQEVTTSENSGLKVTKTGTSVSVDFDETVTFILFGGDATSAWNVPEIK